MKRLLPVMALAAVTLWSAPVLAHSYDCAQDDYAPEGIWEPTDADMRQFFQDAEKRPDFATFMYRSCGVIEGGQKMIMSGALHVVDDYAICDDDANFALFYDPRTRSFGEVIPRQKLCGAGRKIPRPMR